MRDHEKGMVTAFVVVLSMALLLMAGLVVDGGLSLAAKLRAVDEAQAAARVGAQQLDLGAYRSTGTVILDPNRAQAAAQSYLSATGHSGDIQIAQDTVTVTVHITQQMQILGFIGLANIPVDGRGEARAERGVDQAQP